MWSVSSIEKIVDNNNIRNISVSTTQPHLILTFCYPCKTTPPCFLSVNQEELQIQLCSLPQSHSLPLCPVITTILNLVSMICLHGFYVYNIYMYLEAIYMALFICFKIFYICYSVYILQPTFVGGVNFF